MTQEQLRMQMLAGIITEGQYKVKLNEINSEEMTKERSPEDLKRVLNDIADQAGEAAGGEGIGFMTELLVLRKLGDKIDSGEITTLGQLETAFKEYLKSLTSGE